LFLLECSEFPEYERKPCGGTWELTDLGPEHKFFNFDDIKPGDYGENTISLHVYDNDAYACMFTRNMQDDDPSLTEPETSAGDNTVGLGNGELSKYVYFFAWHDDGNNVFEAGEEKITEDPVLANPFLSDSVVDLATPGNGKILPAGTTKYIGLAWCAGTMSFAGTDILCDGSLMGNEAQADALSADIGFYVEQVRNNPEFSCQSLIENNEPAD
jgi:hypothetical protein